MTVCIVRDHLNLRYHLTEVLGVGENSPPAFNNFILMFTTTFFLVMKIPTWQLLRKYMVNKNRILVYNLYLRDLGILSYTLCTAPPNKNDLPYIQPNSFK